MSHDLRHKVEDFLFDEADILDRGDWAEWEKLWADTGVYWVPAAVEDYDPRTRLSIVYDDREQIAARVRRMSTGEAYVDVPRAQLSRLIGNVRAHLDGDTVRARASMLLTSCRHERLTTWAAKLSYELEQHDSGFRIRAKTVRLVNADTPIGPFGFIL